MEALGPLDTNANLKAKKLPSKQQVETKAKAVPQGKPLAREKDHPPPPPPEVHEPPCFDRPNGSTYRTGRLLGKGGFAICHEGQLVGSRQRVALKIVKSVMPQKKMEQKFQTELQIHSKMKHPNIVQFHRAFTFQQSTYIVLELCPNGSLLDIIKRRRYITEPEVRFYTIQIAGAVKYMHAKGIIHRDLKMGNIFLDKDMNIKIGDFGLAALLMSGKDMTACRRTTLCGTPNYIAPEIVEKGRKGHDHAVDIWSVGIIIFAMLTGRPPFQASSQEEIYRRARELEYDWPKMEASENYISQEAKDLVSWLLVKPEDRPDPDAIVQHSFFTSGWVPLLEEMSPSFRESAPGPNHFVPVGIRGGRKTNYESSHEKLCRESNVGKYSNFNETPVSTYKEMAAEEKAGLTPSVPLPDDVVYRPFDEWRKEQGLLSVKSAEPQKVSRVVPLDSSHINKASRQIMQSFAAQQRSHYQPSTVPQNSIQIARQHSDPHPEDLRHDSKNVLDEKARKRSTTLTARHIPSHPKSERSAVQETSKTVQGRLGADLVENLNSARVTRDNRVELKQPVTTSSLLNPRENSKLLPGSKPDEILSRLQRLQTELERALNSRSPGPQRDYPPKQPVIVVKWVDYTNKFGLGYILSTGHVGCVFKSMPAHGEVASGVVPPSCILVRDAERHLQNRDNVRYADRHQLVPVSGADIEFYENNGERGVSRVKVNPRYFTVEVGADGEGGKLPRGKDEYDDRKREKIVLWKKFANYMTAFGRDHDCPPDEILNRFVPSKASDLLDAGDFVSFYQRFGDVGCWVFGDGHFQFNFPDHTKIILSADGTWCDFYHLPLEAARDLAETGILPMAALDDRQHLSYSVQTLLNFVAKQPRNGKVSVRTVNRPQIDPMIQGIPAANDFRKKIEFIKQIVAEWVSGGGLGNSAMEPADRLRWFGHREKVNVKMPFKHVWVTVGARQGDDRRVAWFDPRKPHEIVPDIEA